MSSMATLERLQELRELLKFSYDAVLSKLSVREIVTMSYEAGGVLPTLLGYAIGAIGTFGLCVSQSITMRLLSVLLALLFFAQCVQTSDDLASVLLLSVAMVIGIGCTFVQVMSWKAAFAHLDTRRQERAAKKQMTKKINSKVDKED